MYRECTGENITVYQVEADSLTDLHLEVVRAIDNEYGEQEPYFNLVANMNIRDDGTPYYTGIVYVH